MNSKRLLDIVAASGALFLSIPLLIVGAAAVVLETGRPVLYRQERIGVNGAVFEILKLRSMSEGGVGASVTAGGDSRITCVGRILRKSKVDELPQLFNVLKGEMSLVGPRPEVSEFVELYPEQFERLLSVRPGITDYSSIVFRNESEILAAASDPRQHYIDNILPQKIALSERYISKASTAEDLRVIFLTVAAIFGVDVVRYIVRGVATGG